MQNPSSNSSSSSSANLYRPSVSQTTTPAAKPRTTEEIRADTLQTARNARRLASETREMASDTMTGLNLQREQLERAENRLTDINNNLEHAERHIRGIDSWFMSWINGWTSPRQTPREDHTKVREAFERESVKKNAADAKKNASKEAQQKSGSDVRTESVLGDEVDEVLDDLQSIVGDLRAQATTMGHELDYQNHLLDRLNTRVENTHMRVRKDNDRIVRLT